ncbi:MAG: type IVB secretion system protein IcmH/DotU [Chitinispirillaceae bacterium]|nr:type IVB secretion system protein IcmH/DotU [Chitinispirillaceae bacterium]
MAKTFVDTIAGQTLNVDLTKAIGGARDMPGLATDLFLIIIRMREAEDLGDPVSLRKLILHYLDLFKKNCVTAGLAEEAVNEAMYAIVALMDETVLTVPGACRDYWFGRPLQLELFGDNIAGEEFYHKLQKLLAQPEKKKDALEIYYLCLSLGFEGKYRIMNPEERSAIVEETGRKLRRAKIRVSSTLSPHGKRTDYMPPAKKISGQMFPLWAGAVVTVMVCAAGYLAFVLLSNMGLRQALEVLDRMNLR